MYKRAIYSKKDSGTIIVSECCKTIVVSHNYCSVVVLGVGCTVVVQGYETRVVVQGNATSIYSEKYHVDIVNMGIATYVEYDIDFDKLYKRIASSLANQLACVISEKTGETYIKESGYVVIKDFDMIFNYEITVYPNFIGSELVAEVGRIAIEGFHDGGFADGAPTGFDIDTDKLTELLDCEFLKL